MNIELDYNTVRATIISEANSSGSKLREDDEKSVWMRIVSAVAWCFVTFLNPIFRFVFDSIFPQTTTSRYVMRRHLAEEGLDLKLAVKAYGIAHIGSKSKPESEKEIPQNTVIYTEGKSPLYFETTEVGTIGPDTEQDDKGYYTIPISIQALDTGSTHNVPAETIIYLDNPPDGIDVCYNPDACEGGDAEETLESAYKRLKDAKTGISRGTLSWYVSETQKNFTEIEQAWGIPRYAGRGTLGIAVAGRGGDASDETLLAIESFFNTDEIDPAGSYTVIASRPTSIITDYDITIWYDTSLSIPSDADLLIILNSYLSSLLPGKDQILENIKAKYQASSLGIKDIQINSPAMNVIIPPLNVSRLGTAVFTKIPFTDQDA